MKNIESLNKENQSAIRFEAAFYADLKLLKQCIKSKEDLNLQVATPKGSYWMWEKPSIEISILDILNWLAFGLYDYYDTQEICRRSFNAEGIQNLNQCINPSIIYRNALDCITWICDTFSIINYGLKDYSPYRLFRHCLFEDENYLDEETVQEALEEGFRKMDLDLIDVSERGDAVAAYSLVKQGADYKIDPLDKLDESVIVEMLDSDRGFHTLLWISYFYNRKKFNFSDSYDMLSSLYLVGVGSYILDIVTMND